jgi:CRP/FNR family cyclic AMP-dependent transcriptional regulator
MAYANDANMLITLPIFQGITAEHWPTLVALLHARSVPEGAMIISAEQPGEVAYVIQSGTVKISVDRVDGTEVIVALRGPGELVGELSLIDDESRSANVITLEPCTLWWIDRPALRSCLYSMPELSFNLLRVLSRRLRAATAQIQAMATLDIAGRLARQILIFADLYGQAEANGAVRIPLRLTQSELAGLVGATRASVNEAIVSFKHLGYITVDARQHYTVRNRKALAQRSQ